MAPWGDPNVGAVVSAEKAFLFISKSWRDVRNSADEDLRRLKARAKPFTDLANRLDRKLENLRESSFNLGSDRSYGSLLSRRKDGGDFQAWLSVTPGEEFEFVKNLKPRFSQFRRSRSNADLCKQQTDVLEGWRQPQKIDFSLLRKALIPYVKDEDFNPRTEDDTDAENAQGPKHGAVLEQRLAIKDSKSLKARRVWSSSDEWDPLKRFKDTWKSLEAAASHSKSPSDFFEGLKKSQLFESFKRNPDVPPLDVAELLASLLRQSEPWLDELGVKKEVVDRVSDMLQKYRWKDFSLSVFANASTDATVPGKDSGKNMDELDLRLASVLQSTGYRYRNGIWGEQVKKYTEDGCRNIAIFTTASLPWMTGTAINPLFRAAYLARNGNQNVTLLVPWLCKGDQLIVYPNQMSFDNPEEQETYIRNWLEARIGFSPDFKIAFYPGKFSKEKRSILASGDISQLIPDKEADIAVLEEPEHLTWYYHGKRWTDKFRHVVGVVHTNYLEYARREKNGPLQAFLLRHINNWVTRIYCHKVVCLSAATQKLPRSIVSNIHGVGPKFLEIGQRLSAQQESEKLAFTKGAYFLGKMVWSKGYRELVDLLAKHRSDLGNLQLDVFGTGEDFTEVQAAAQKLGLGMNFYQGRDHADEIIHGYKVFINPSISDVVCTTTAEALAMGKIVVCADHPSNEFFRSFSNCFTYKNSEEFVEKVKHAMSVDPVPLSPEQRHLLSWEASTERFIKSAGLDQPLNEQKVVPSSNGIMRQKSMALSLSMPDLSQLMDNGFALAHYCLTGNEAARLISGALPGTINYNLEHSKDLHLPPPAVQSPVYGW